MQVFGGSPLTPTRTIDHSRDGTTPRPGSLNLNDMCCPAALPGTNAPHSEVIHGDWQHKIAGSVKLTIDGKSDTTVQGDVTEHYNQNCTTTVTSNDTLKIHGNSTMVVNGSELNTTLGPTLETKIGEHTQVHQAAEHNQDTSAFETHWYSHSAFGERFEADGLLVNPIGIHFDLVGNRWTAGVLVNDYRVWGFHAKAGHNEDNELEAKFKGIEADITELKGELTPVTIKVNPTRIISTAMYVVAGPPVVGSILDALIAEFALAAAF
jgi:hypothetical protein